MILSSISDSKKIKQAINLIIKEFDINLCCEVVSAKNHSNSFIVKNWMIDEDDFYVAHIMVKKRRTNWLTLLDLIPILGEAWVHYDFFSSFKSHPIDGMSRLDELYYYWKTGINYLKREGFEVDEKECYAYMIQQTTEWREL
jgi:hypothetical protein